MRWLGLRSARKQGTVVMSPPVHPSCQFVVLLGWMRQGKVTNGHARDEEPLPGGEGLTGEGERWRPIGLRISVSCFRLTKPWRRDLVGLGTGQRDWLEHRGASGSARVSDGALPRSRIGTGSSLSIVWSHDADG